MACGRCIEVCTRDVNPFSVYFAFRRIQTREFSIPAVAEEALRLLYETGHAIIAGNAEELRRQLNLPELKSAFTDQKALSEVRQILESTEIAQLGILPRRETL